MGADIHKHRELERKRDAQKSSTAKPELIVTGWWQKKLQLQLSQSLSSLSLSLSLSWKLLKWGAEDQK